MFKELHTLAQAAQSYALLLGENRYCYEILGEQTKYSQWRKERTLILQVHHSEGSLLLLYVLTLCGFVHCAHSCNGQNFSCMSA